jgi:non-specific serine/threonine protein kinase/serine/threonine-protein kinase
MADDRPVSPGPQEDVTRALGPADRVRPDAEVGSMIGPYRLLRRLGTGGMGEVFEAEQTEPIRRRVAVKVIKQGMDTRAVVARFEAERQALAMMDHPGIARVHQAGATERGRPFFAMEYVDGEPITDYCDRRRLGTRARLELFVRVCEGVQHAHQKAVIHRDLKPTNILVTEVDGEPLPKIIDFGVAKAMDQGLAGTTLLTELGQMVGTPAYMSPEQAGASGADIDTRTDVYALGVVLYELLVGERPFEQDMREATHEVIRRIICEQDPQRPSLRISTLGDASCGLAAARDSAPRRLRSELRGDLDWITMKALEKERTRRYETVNGLAADLRRHLNDDPVSAGPPTASYRAAKFVRRHRAGVSIAAVAVVALTAFAAFSTFQARAIARERDRAEAAGARAEAMNAFLAGTLASADPWSGSGREVTVVQAVDAARERIATDFAGQPELEAAMRTVLGQTYLGLGELAPATEQIERALEIRRGMAAAAPREMGLLLVTEAGLRRDAADPDAALASAATAARIFRDDPSARPADLLLAYHHEARNLLDTRRYAAAESVLTLCEVVAPRVTGEQRILVAENHSLRADLLRERDGDAAAADSLSRVALATARAIDPDHAVLTQYLNNAAQYRSESGDLEGALADFDAALALYEQSFGTDHPEYATCLENRGGVLYRLGRPDETFAALEQVRDIRQRNLGPDHIDVVRTSLNMGTVASLAGDHERALAIFAELEPALIAARGTEHPDVLAVRRNEGTALRGLGRLEEARDVFAEATALAERLFGADDPRTGVARGDLGLMLFSTGDHAAAEPQLVASFEALLARLGPEHPATRKGAENLVAFYEETRRPDAAETYRAYLGESGR